ncbi:MAG: hypothetical protein QOI36_489 [Pseudonocardiales bacterium]|jgi:hypothetical protein|nr:hypothetical protein [Pseudonocardia sp.]MDT7649083.1 hypothetical protein [Pseudonocardiales bacterium]
MDGSGTVEDELDRMNDVLALIMVLAVFGVALGGLAWLALRVRHRGIGGDSAR